MTREEIYIQGFAQKCAEFGVNPEALIKASGILDTYNDAQAGLDKMHDQWKPYLERGADAGVRLLDNEPDDIMKAMLYGKGNPFWERLMDNASDEYNDSIKPTVQNIVAKLSGLLNKGEE